MGKLTIHVSLPEGNLYNPNSWECFTELLFPGIHSQNLMDLNGTSKWPSPIGTQNTFVQVPRQVWKGAAVWFQPKQMRNV